MEKSHQVPLMGTIYSVARRVIIWLGSHRRHQNHETAESISTLANACRAWKDERAEGLEHLRPPTGSLTPEILASLKALFHQPWFRRVWCIQEIKLARDAAVLWGPLELPWADVGEVATWISVQLINGDPEDDMTQALDHMDVTNAESMYRPGSSMHEKDLVRVLKRYRDWEATDPRDKVYGLLNLAKPESGKQALIVDYNKPVGEVFTDTVLVSIQNRRRLISLVYVSHPEHFEISNGYPSWVPDWADPHSVDDLGIPESLCWWRAGGRYSPKWSTSDHNSVRQISLSGLDFDTVVNVSDIMEDTPFNTKARGLFRKDRKLHPIIVAWQTLGAPRPSYLDLDDTSYEQWQIMARTFTMCETEEALLIEEPRTGDDGQVAHTSAFIKIMQTLIARAYPDSNNYEESLDHSTFMFQKNMFHLCEQRRVFWTQNGTYGIGPQSMRASDIVVVLFGGNTPYVLRPHGGKYLFMGQAYVDCLMKGELVEQMEAGKLQEQEFCLI